jgi:hypothetical protein
MDSILENFIFIEQDAPIKQPDINKPISLWIFDQGIIRSSSNIVVGQKLDPGMYSVDINRDYGIFCKKIDACSDELFVFSNSIIVDLIEEINLFWSKADLYKQNNLVHKRGILLEGYPGTGKTSIISLLSKEIIDKGGLVFKVSSPKNLLYYITFIKESFRKIEPDTPIITIIEDIDDYQDYGLELLDFLDGKSQIEHHVVIATTNNTEDIDDTFLRPSRLDLRIEVELPDEQIREEYFRHKSVPEDMLDELVKRSEEFSIADLKELYICIFLLGYSLDKAIEKISNTREKKNYTDVGNKNYQISI